MTNQVPILEDLRLVPVPEWWENPWVWIPSLLALGAGIWWVIRWWNQRPRPTPPPPPPIPGPPPHLEALRRLAELRAVHQQMNAYRIATEGSEILRDYLQARLALPVRYQTTREFLAEADRMTDWKPAQSGALRRFLQFFDRIKFAGETATPAASLAVLDDMEQFVREEAKTVPKGEGHP